MKTLIGILAASAVAALSVPVAGATIPADAHERVAPRQLAGQTTQTPAKGSVKGSRYDRQAYVPGGSGRAVSAAIVAKGKRGLR